MQTVMLRSHLEMPIVGLGTWQMLDGEATTAVTSALKVGYRLIDTALVYKNDVAIGEALMGSTVPRSAA